MKCRFPGNLVGSIKRTILFHGLFMNQQGMYLFHIVILVLGSIVCMIKKIIKLLLPKIQLLACQVTKNDLDGFGSFPLSSISDDGYAVGAINAIDVLELAGINSIPFPMKIADMNIDSNPVIMIVKLKK